MGKMRDKTLTEYFRQAVDSAKERKERGFPDFATGLSFIDEVTDGMHKGELWIVAGKSGSGKTNLTLQLAKSFSDNPEHTILFISLEMKGSELLTRMFCEFINWDTSEFIKGNLPTDFKEKEKRFNEYLKTIDMEIAEHKGYVFSDLISIIKEGYPEKRPDIIMLDFIQLIEKKGFKDERHALEAYVRKLKELANVYNIGIVLISQLRRLPSGSDYNREPDMMDLLGTGSLEQMADKVMLIYKAKDKTGKILNFIKLAKNRQGEKVKREVIFEGRYSRFKEIEVPKEVSDIQKEFGGKLWI